MEAKNKIDRLTPSSAAVKSSAVPTGSARAQRIGRKRTVAQNIDLKNKVAIVTGGSQGLGFEMALGLAQSGGRVTIASPDKPRLEKSQAEIGKDRCHMVVGDITKPADCQRIFDETLSRFGQLDVLVNNARRDLTKAHLPIWEADVEFWESAVKVNIFGTFMMTRTCVPYLKKRGAGRIVNITTSIDTIQRERNAPYGMTKAAIEAETVIWSKELAGSGVTVNSLIPGGSCDVRGGRTRPSASQKALLPPDVMVPAVIWLASDLSDGHNGGRYVGKLWDRSLPPGEAAKKALEPSIFRPE
jgi:NAD(P)-dependent dehydrogenase (short-subunit alcohol dehydrogenase family)